MRRSKGKVLSILIALLCLCSVVYGATNDIVLNQFQLSTSNDIEEDDVFSINFKFKNQSGGDISDVYFKVLSGPFLIDGKGQTVSIESGTVSNNGIIEEDLDFNYDGSDNNRLEYRIIYTKGASEYEYDDAIYISNIDPTSSSSSSSSSKERKPNVELENTSRNIDVVVGQTKNINIQVINNGDYSARKIEMTPVVDDIDAFPFKVEEMSLPDKMKKLTSDDSDYFTFRLIPKINLEEKVYPVKFKIKFENSTGDAYENEQTVYFNVTNKNVSPEVVIDKVDFKGDGLIAGEQNTVSLILNNNGDNLAKDIEISLTNLSADGFYVMNTEIKKEVDEVEKGKFEYTIFYLVPNKNLKSNTYELKTNIAYKDEYGNKYDKEQILYVPVLGEDEVSGELDIIDIVTPTDEVNAEDDFAIKFNLENTGDTDLKNVKVTLSKDESIISKSLSVIYIKDLKAGEKKPVEFLLFGKAEIETKNYPIMIDVEYTGSDKGSTEKVSKYAGVYLKGSDEGGTPKLILKNYTSSKEFVYAGDTVDMNLTFENTNKVKDIKNIKISLSAEKGAFSPVGNSNTIFVDEIKAGSVYNKVMTFKAKRDGEPNTYAVTLNMEYEDNKGKNYSTEEQVSLALAQETKLLIQEIETPPEAYVSNPINLSVQFFNTGKATMYNLMVSTEGEFGKQDSMVYIGNFEPGKGDYFDTTVIPTEVGMLTGKIKFVYEDVVGETKEIEKEFSVNVNEMPDYGDEEEYPVEPMPEENNNKKYYIIAAILLALAAGGFIIKKRIAKKKEMELDE